jgi:3-oxoacyl-[acyl-carrier-protein] synthase I
MNARAHKLEPRPGPWRDKRGERIGMCLTGGLGPELCGYDRLLALAEPALREALAELGVDGAPLLLSLPARDRPDDERRLDAGLVRDLGRRVGGAIDVGRSWAVRADQAGGVLAAERALGLLAAGAPAVVVGGVDSYCHPAVLRWLDAQGRLVSLAAADGLVPSEGAAFFVLRSQTEARETAEPRPSSWLTHAASTLGPTGAEAAPALTQLLASIARETGPIRWLASDVTNEPERIGEWTRVLVSGLMAADVTEQRLPSDFGDLGAASGPMAVVVASVLHRTRCAPADACVIALRSRGPERGVLRVASAP